MCAPVLAHNSCNPQTLDVSVQPTCTRSRNSSGAHVCTFAMQAMQDLEAIVQRFQLSIWMWPEGTRSRDGRLRRSTSGPGRLAVQLMLPVVSVVPL